MGLDVEIRVLGHAWSDITLQLLDVRVGLDALHIIGRAILRFFIMTIKNEKNLPCCLFFPPVLKSSVFDPGFYF